HRQFFDKIRGRRRPRQEPSLVPYELLDLKARIPLRKHKEDCRQKNRIFYQQKGRKDPLAGESFRLSAHFGVPHSMHVHSNRKESPAARGSVFLRRSRCIPIHSTHPKALCLSAPAVLNSVKFAPPKVPFPAAGSTHRE